MKAKIKKTSYNDVNASNVFKRKFAYRFATNIWDTGVGGINIGGRNSPIGSPLRSKTGTGTQTFIVTDSILKQSLQPERIYSRLRWRNGYGTEGNCTEFSGVYVGTRLAAESSNWPRAGTNYSSPRDVSGDAANQKDYYLQIYSGDNNGDIIWANWNLN